MTKREKRDKFYKVQKRKCAFCGKFCAYRGTGVEPTLFSLEHIVPRRFGGKTYKNVVGACVKCNTARAVLIQRAQIAEHPKHLERCVKEREIYTSRYTIWN